MLRKVLISVRVLGAESVENVGVRLPNGVASYRRRAGS